MPGTHYSYLDLSVHQALRKRVLSSDPAILFSGQMDAILWANAPGSAFFGGSGIADLLSNRLNRDQPFVRQIANAVSQIEDDEPLVRGFRVAKGLRTELIQCELSRVSLSQDDHALLLVCRDERTGRTPREHELAQGAVDSLAGFADSAAVVDEFGLPIGATESFAEMDIDPDVLLELVQEAAHESDRLVKRAQTSAVGTTLAIGIGRIHDRPARYLVVCAAPASAEAEQDTGDATEPSDIVHMPEDGEVIASDFVEAQAHEPGVSAGLNDRLPEDEPDLAPEDYEEEQLFHPGSERDEEKLASEPAGELAHDMDEADGSPLDDAGEDEASMPSQRKPSLLDRWYAGVERGAAREAVADEDRGSPTVQFEKQEMAQDSETPESDAPVQFSFRAGGAPVRFAWIIDADQQFRSVSPELAQTVGPNAADIVGRKWRDVARVFGFDRTNDIARLLEKRDTWSGKSVFWPVQGTDLAVPIDLAALPAFDAARRFDGFRGFGIIRTADAIIDPEETGKALEARSDAPEFDAGHDDLTESNAVEERHWELPLEDKAARQSAPEDEHAQDSAMHRGDNIVPLTSRRKPEGNDRLNQRESQAFSEIGRTLRSVEPADSDDGSSKEATAEVAEAQSSQGTQGTHGAQGGGRPAIDTSLLNQLPAPILIYRNGATLFANPELLTLSGYDSVDELARAGGVDALLSGDSVDGDGMHHSRLSRRDGSSIAINPVLQTVPWDGGKALLLTFRTRSSEVQHEKAAIDIARVSELQNILDTATDGIIIIDRDGQIASVNSSAEALFGTDFDSAAGKHLTDFFAQESHKPLTDYINELSQPGVAGIINDGREVIAKEANGGLIPLFVTIGRMGTDGKLCLVLRDITQWKKAEEELVGARRAAELASEQKTDFLARVSHEIRTPLNAIIGFSDVMIEERFGPVGNERYREYLRDINRSGVHVLDLINDLLDISKIEAGKIDLTYEAVDLNQIVSETVALLQPQANRERIIIRTSLSRAVPRVVADARSIRQIILNLVSNAIKFTPMNGQVIVSTVYEGNGEVALRVRDTGRGMTEKEIETAMKPFHQIGTVEEKRGQGTGLGLPLTKALVEANRAYFDIESTPGEGTIANVHFPTQRVLAD
ncbi:MAG: ATP-binding protein [Rhizobiaceae bacterium]